MSKSFNEIKYTNSMDIDINDVPPMLTQYLDIKRKNPELLLLYRLGDFYECFFEDAVKISKLLELTLTARDGGGSVGKYHMAGVPAKAVEGYIERLLNLGCKVAICEQLEDPTATKGLVKRDIVRIITPGTLTEERLLQANTNNYLAALYYEKKIDMWGLAFVDISTGEFKVTQSSYNQILSELARIQPAEILAATIPQTLLPFQIVQEHKIDLPPEITKVYNCSPVSPTFFEEIRAKANITEILKIKTLEALAFNDYKIGFLCVGAILQYLLNTQKEGIPEISAIDTYDLSAYVLMDSATRKNLELLETVREKKKFGSLLWAIDSTKSNMGERLLKKWLSQPLKDIKEIKKRQEAVEILTSNNELRLELSNLLENISDIQRLSSRLSNNTITPRDFIALKNTLKLLPLFAELLQSLDNDYFYIYTNVDYLVQFAELIERTLIEEPPITIKEGGLINQGANEELDYFRGLLNNGEDWLVKYEEEERKQTGIKNLKIGYSKVFGYFIEITNSYLNQKPHNYIRKQTLTGCERFITEKLKSHEDNVLSAKSKSTELEYKIFCDLREYAKEFIEPIRTVADNLSRIDVILSFAMTAVANNYVKPEITEQNELLIKNGRHPVVEKILPLGEYVANDLKLASKENDYSIAQFMILTGPNMAGKSTYMRQQALIVILAQIGSFIPAEYAKIGIVDKIFTRVGAVDDLSLGQSTFMVEMTETAFILNTATEKSLILLDEIGRGTSTYDGVAIAWSVAEYISQKIKARTIFATHYHELNVMPNSYPQIKNYRVTISENSEEIIFLRKVVEGSASKSYGVQVAKMAGLPSSVVEKAQTLMTKLQKDFSKDLSKGKNKDLKVDVPQLSLLFNTSDK